MQMRFFCIFLHIQEPMVFCIFCIFLAFFFCIYLHLFAFICMAFFAISICTSPPPPCPSTAHHIARLTSRPFLFQAEQRLHSVFAQLQHGVDSLDRQCSMEALLNDLQAEGDQPVQRVCKFALGLLRQRRPYARRSMAMWTPSTPTPDSPRSLRSPSQSSIVWSDSASHRVKASGSTTTMVRSNSETALRSESLLRLLR